MKHTQKNARILRKGESGERNKYREENRDYLKYFHTFNIKPLLVEFKPFVSRNLIKDGLNNRKFEFIFYILLHTQ